MPEKIEQPESPEKSFFKEALRKMKIELDLGGLVDQIAPIRIVSPPNKFDHIDDRGTIEATEIAFKKILNDEAVNYKDLSYKQKLDILLQLGKDGGGGYDTDRRNNLSDRKTLTKEQFLANNRARYAVEDLIRQFKNDHRFELDQNRPLNESELDKLFTELSETTKLSKDQIRELYEQNDQDLNKLQTNLLDNHLKLGVCGDIHKFIRQLAKEMGLKDAFTTNTSWQGSAHVVAGFKDEEGNFVFINYGGVISTGTKDFQQALSLLEQNQQSVALKYNIQDAEGHTTVVQSAAGKQMEKIASGKEENRVAELLEKGLTKDKNRLKLRIAPELSSLTIDREFLDGAAIIELTRVRNEDILHPENSKNSVGQAHSLRLGYQQTGETLAGGLSATILEGETKQIPLNEKNRPQFIKLFIHAYLETHKEIEITPNLIYTLAAYANFLFDSSLSHSSNDHRDLASRFSSISLDLDHGHQLDIIGRNHTLFLRLQFDHSLTPKKIEEVTLDPNTLDTRTDESTATFGGLIPLGPAKAFTAKLHAAVADPRSQHHDFQTKKFSIDLGLIQPKSISANLSAALTKSDSPFIADTQQLNAAISHPIDALRITLYGTAANSETSPPHLTGGITLELIPNSN